MVDGIEIPKLQNPPIARQAQAYNVQLSTVNIVWDNTKRQFLRKPSVAKPVRRFPANRNKDVWPFKRRFTHFSPPDSPCFHVEGKTCRYQFGFCIGSPYIAEPIHISHKVRYLCLQRLDANPINCLPLTSCCSHLCHHSPFSDVRVQNNASPEICDHI